MTPLMQDKFNHTFKYGGGNCLQAAVASLLDLPLEAVPHFMLFGDKLWWDALYTYIQSQGHELLGWVDGTPPSNNKFYLCSMECGDKEFSHAVIVKNGEVVHDPHPDKNVSGYWIAGYYEIRYNTAINAQ